MVKIVEVSQFFDTFFDTKGMNWKDLIKIKDKPVLLSEDKTTCLWTETPKIREVKEGEYPSKGDVWLKEGKEGKIEIFKTNYDSSD